MNNSKCQKCAWMREVITPRGSRFLLCRLSETNYGYPKYPPQPVLECPAHQAGTDNQIALALKQFLAATSPDPMGLRKIAADLQALPLMLDMGGCFAVRCNGEVISFAWDTPAEVRVEKDPRIRNIVFFQGSQKYPSLRFLILPRLADAVDCPQCGGTRKMDIPIKDLVCYCGGLGWVPG
jgi:hypothetical protein